MAKTDTWNVLAKSDLPHRNNDCLCPNKLFKQNPNLLLLLLENVLTHEGLHLISTRSTRSVNISGFLNFNFPGGGGERKAHRLCLELMTTLVDTVLPTSWGITEWVKTPIWTKLKTSLRSNHNFQGSYEIRFKLPYFSLRRSNSQN